MEEEINRTTQILAFVLDSFQVVSYKWLSRKFSITSNEAKRLLQIVAEQHGSSVDVIYAVSGWSKAAGRCYSVQLVPKSKLQQAKDMLDGHVSSHVYSIQPCIPKDPAELWSAEYVQSEELFKQPPELNNCLRDNRFSSVTCMSVTRKVSGQSSAGNAHLAAPKVDAPSSSSCKPLIMQAEVLAAQLPTSGPPSFSKQNGLANSVKDAGTISHGPATVTGPGKKGVVTAPTKKKMTGSGDSALANLWGRTSIKPKPILPEAQIGLAVDDPATGNADTLARSHDDSFNASSDDDAANFAHIWRGQVKGTSRRMRRMVVDDDMSDEEDEELDSENIVSLSSPEVPKERSETSAVSKRHSSTGKPPETAAPKEKKVKTSSGRKDTGLSPSSAHTSPKEVRVDSADTNLDSKKKSGNNDFKAEDETNKSVHMAEKGTSSTAAPGPKKRKVLKTYIDDRGREVTEVVWENEDTTVSHLNEDESRQRDANALAHAQIEPSKVSSNRSLGSAIAKTSNAAAQNPSNKASGNKPSGKAASKDSQQGKISSFFKKKS